MSDKSNTFKLIFDRNYRRMLYLALRFVKNEADAEDIVADIFCDLWSRMDSIDLDSGITTYLYKAVTTRALNFLRRSNASAVRIEALESINQKRLEFIDRHNPDESVHSREIDKGINDALALLPEKCRQVFILSYIDGVRNKDIAEAMGVSVRTVEAHIYKALRLLREKLNYLLTILIIFGIGVSSIFI